MKEESKSMLKLSIFVTVSLVILIAGIYLIGESNKLFSSTFRLVSCFKDVNGLQVGNNVQFAGIAVGTIESIDIITDTAVQVSFMVDLKAQPFIKTGAKAVIGSDGLMGNKILIITPGLSSEKAVVDNDIIASTRPIRIDEILSSLKKTSDNTAQLSGDLTIIVNNIKQGRGTIGKLFMDTAFASNIDKTMLNVKQGTKGFKQNMDAAQKSILLRGYFKKNKKK
ncbi:MAG: MlaD family protein [Bacteroidia bacterium]|jgi:phospholipid/cholesterol/gamma-HCH transport system substrate-binding protein|nr:MlaD family protein [Bacteroidia bacterium]